MPIKIKKGLQRHHISHATLGQILTFGVTPYESQNFPVNATPNPVSYIWEGAGAGGRIDFSTGVPRADIKLLAAKGSGLGWTLTHQAKGRGDDYSQLKGNRLLSTYVHELSDGADMTWANRSGGQVANSIIVPDGVSSRRGQGGLDLLTIQSATPDYFLGKLELPQMSYMLGDPAYKERKSWYDLCTYGFDTAKPAPNPLPDTLALRRASAQNQLGYTFKGADSDGIYNGVYNDPFGGFGYYTDQYTITVGQAMQPRPCNEYHLFYKLSSSRVLCEILTNHVKVSNRNGTNYMALPIGSVFNMSDIRVGDDIEHDILTANVSGTINSIISEMAENGVWRAWWDSQCNFHFIPDYYASVGNVGIITPSLLLKEGVSLIGDLEVNIGSDAPIINRAEVKGQPFISFGDATADPLTTNINRQLGAVYPPGQKKGGVGSDVTMDNYLGRNSAEQARRLYNRANARTTFKWSNFPYPTLAFAMLNRVVAITAKDPKGNWSFTDKNFVVTEVEIQLQEAERGDGGYYLCSMSGIEIDASFIGKPAGIGGGS